TRFAKPQCLHNLSNQEHAMSTSNSTNDEGVFQPLPPESDVPAGVDRRSFFLWDPRHCAAWASAPTPRSPKGRAHHTANRTQQPKIATTHSANLDVEKKSKGPVMTMADEFYKVGPGPSSSHTIGPMRITYDFYQRCTKLPADQLAQATGLKVHLFGSLSATGK